MFEVFTVLTSFVTHAPTVAYEDLEIYFIQREMGVLVFVVCNVRNHLFFSPAEERQVEHQQTRPSYLSQLAGCVIGVLAGCVIGVLVGCVIGVLAGCVIGVLAVL